MRILGNQDEARYHQAVADECHGMAWDLIEQIELSPEDTARLAQLASAALYHRKFFGRASGNAHATLLFAWAMARCGAGEVALQAGQQALEFFEGNLSKDWERAFAHAAMATACHAAVDVEGYMHHYQTAHRLMQRLRQDEAGNFMAAFRTVPSFPPAELVQDEDDLEYEDDCEDGDDQAA
ncbi:MAG: hypothetical protein AAFX00_01465 [Pseudomonadota bacterium]